MNVGEANAPKERVEVRRGQKRHAPTTRVPHRDDCSCKTRAPSANLKFGNKRVLGRLRLGAKWRVQRNDDEINALFLYVGYLICRHWLPLSLSVLVRFGMSAA